jgi:cation/acetate symporter
MVAGTVTSLVLIYLSPTIQIDVLHHATAPFPLRNPGLISMPLAVLTGIGASLLWPDREAEARFVEVERRVHFGA